MGGQSRTVSHIPESNDNADCPRDPRIIGYLILLVVIVGGLPNLLTRSFDSFGALLVLLFLAGGGITLVFFALSLFRAALTANWTIYAVTNRRILIIKQLRLGEKAVGAYAREFVIERNKLGNERGDLIFTNVRTEEYVGRNRPPLQNIITFYGIENVAEVEQLILDTFPVPLASVIDRRYYLR